LGVATDKAERFLEDSFGKISTHFAADQRGADDRRSDFTP
jgi:hypothetical protein